MQDRYSNHIGILNRSESFLACADIIKDNIEPGPTHTIYLFPMYYLYAHALELAIKSYIDFVFQSEDKLKKIGHDIEHAWNTAIENDIEKVFLVNEKFEAVINILNPIYKTKSLEYHMSGLCQLLDPTIVSKEINALVSSLKKHYCSEWRKSSKS